MNGGPLLNKLFPIAWGHAGIGSPPDGRARHASAARCDRTQSPQIVRRDLDRNSRSHHESLPCFDDLGIARFKQTTTVGNYDCTQEQQPRYSRRACLTHSGCAAMESVIACLREKSPRPARRVRLNTTRNQKRLNRTQLLRSKCMQLTGCICDGRPITRLRTGRVTQPYKEVAGSRVGVENRRRASLWNFGNKRSG
jgi:hypothetical protein